MKYYKLSMEMNRENDIICHFDDKFTIPQNALIMGKYFNQWDDKTVIRFSIEEGSVWTDYLANDKGWFLVSEKLKKILESVDTDIQFLKVTVEEYNGLRLSRKYYCANVLQVVGALCFSFFSEEKYNTVCKDQTIGTDAYSILPAGGAGICGRIFFRSDNNAF